MTITTMSRLEELNDLQDRARRVDVRKDEEFQAILRDARGVLEMSESQIADGLSISRPTFNRWINGRSLPHIAMRNPAIIWILDQLDSRIKHRTACLRSDLKTKTKQRPAYPRTDSNSKVKHRAAYSHGN